MTNPWISKATDEIQFSWNEEKRSNNIKSVTLLTWSYFNHRNISADYVMADVDKMHRKTREQMHLLLQIDGHPWRHNNRTGNYYKATEAISAPVKCELGYKQTRLFSVAIGLIFKLKHENMKGWEKSGKQNRIKSRCINWISRKKCIRSHPVVCFEWQNLESVF